MSQLFGTGRIALLIIALVVVEAVALVLLHRKTGRGASVGALLWNLLAGGALLVALYNALVGAPWPWIALWLLVALGAHLADLSHRLRR